MNNVEEIIYEFEIAQRLKDLGISEQQIAEILASARMKREKYAKFEKEIQAQQKSKELGIFKSPSEMMGEKERSYDIYNREEQQKEQSYDIYNREEQQKEQHRTR